MCDRYDQIGRTYANTRKQDPRIARLIEMALGDAESVLNVGAGTGSYEPANRDVVAVEPSETMIRQRLKGAASAIQARAEALPLADKSFDAVLAANTIHHWSNVPGGLREVRRVCRGRIVFFLRNPCEGVALWLTEQYFPSLASDRKMAEIVRVIEEELGPVERVKIPLPAECADGLFSGYWARPEMYLDSEVRGNISNFALADQDVVLRGVASRRSDLESGEWDRKYGHLRSLPDIDLGLRLLIADVGVSASQ